MSYQPSQIPTPVVITASTTTLSISATTLPLGTGGSTLSEQQSQTTKLTNIDTHIDINTSSLLQGITGNSTDNFTALDNLIIARLNILGQNVMSASTPVVIASNQSTIKTTYDNASIQMDAGSRLRVSQLTSLLDGKILNSDNIYVWDNQGTGTGTFSANTYNLSATTGQYMIRSSKIYSPYFAGKSQFVECTFDNFQIETGINKKAGYFSSSTVAPYSATTDGFYLENDGTTYRLKAERSGVETINIPWTSWDNYSSVSGYNWSNFTVIAFDFLWLGGAVLRLFLKTDKGFELCHTFNYAGSTTGTFIKSPNQPIRYEIRSTTGTGSFRYICSQVSSEGSFNESGYNNGVYSLSTAAIPSNTFATVGTSYPILALRKKSTNRDNSIKLTNASFFVTSTNDICIWSLQLNPTLSAPLTYTDLPNSGLQQANASAVAAVTTTVTTEGRILATGLLTQFTVIPSDIFADCFLSSLGVTLNGTSDELVLVLKLLTATVTANATINFKEF